MIFVSYEFLVFLTIAVLFYYLFSKTQQWMILLAFSLLFYASTGIGYITYILVSAFSIWGFALLIEKKRVKGKQEIQSRNLTGSEKKEYLTKLKKKLKYILGMGILLNLGILLTVKYTNFAIWNLNELLVLSGWGEPLEFVSWLMPLGISYYTLQAMGYLIDIYHGKEKAEKNPFRVLLFLSFFPQVIQGPVSHFDKLKESLFCQHLWSWPRISVGLQRILWGFFKKLVVADRIAPVVLAIGQNSHELGGIYVLIGMLSYTLQLYGDFTGGIDIAIGCAQLFGVELPENFKSPFASVSLAEYWRRWHITLMQWFREYIFYPLAGNGIPKSVMRLGKRIGGKPLASRLPVYIASIVTWFLTGIWHGASWNFVAWGLANCMILLISQELTPFYRSFHKNHQFASTTLYQRFMVIRTILLVSSVQMFEYYPSPSEAVRMFFQMFTSFRLGSLLDGSFSLLGITAADIVILLFSVVFFTMIGTIQNREGVGVWLKKKPEWFRFSAWLGLFLAVLILGKYGQGYDVSQFIYNQF